MHPENPPCTFTFGESHCGSGIPPRNRLCGNDSYKNTEKDGKVVLTFSFYYK